MANNNYDIVSTDSNTHYSVQENETNTDTSVTLIGHGRPEYGVDQNTNFLHLLENFAYEKEPKNPIIGQLWYKKLGNYRYELKVCKKSRNDEGSITENDRWDSLAHVNTSEEPINPQDGDIWYDIENHKLKIYDSSLGTGELGWNIIGPTDVVHTVHLYDSKVINKTESDTTYCDIPATYFLTDVPNDNDTLYPAWGSLSLVTVKILTKEAYNEPVSSPEAKCCCFIYKFLVQVQKSGTTFNAPEIVGSPSYEVIAKSEGADMEINIEIKNSCPRINVTDSSSTFDSSIRNIIGFDIEIVRV